MLLPVNLVNVASAGNHVSVQYPDRNLLPILSGKVPYVSSALLLVLESSENIQK